MTGRYLSIDFASGAVEEVEELELLHAQLRRLALKINEAPEGEEKAELRQRYRALQKRLRELGGDADLKDSYAGDGLTAAVHDVVADFVPVLEDDPHDDAVELAEAQEQPPAEEGPASTYFGVDELLKIAGEAEQERDWNVDELPESVREDAELHEALRQQAEADAFGDITGDDLSDDEMWAEFRKTLGEDA